MAHKLIPIIWNQKCLVDITNFINIKNHFNHFLIYLQFLVHCNVFVLAQIYSNITSYELLKCSFFSISFFKVLTYHNIQKHCENLP